jgi:uncharacterized protein with HEPN domain
MSSNQRKPKAPLDIVRQARLQVTRIRDWTANHDADMFAADERTRYAVERAFIAIGEAVKDLSRTIDLAGTDPAGPWREPARFRDFLAHDYDDQVIPTLLWNTIAVDLSVLDEALARVETAITSANNNG